MDDTPRSLMRLAVAHYLEAAKQLQAVAMKTAQPWVIESLTGRAVTGAEAFGDRIRRELRAHRS